MIFPQPYRKNLRYAAIRASLEAAAIGARIRPLGGRGVIFTLHHVRPEGGQPFDPNAILSVTPEFLDETIRIAIASGLTPVHLHELPSLLGSSDSRKFVAFTLDDGYRNNLQYAAPVFRRHKTPFTIFVTSGLVDRTRSMWWETIAAICRQDGKIRFDFGAGRETVQLTGETRKLAAFERFTEYAKTEREDAAVDAIDRLARSLGIEPMGIVDDLLMTHGELKAAAPDPLLHLGAHTLTHVNLNRVDDDRLAAEIEGSARWVAAHSGYPPLSFAYPYGWRTAVGPREIAAVARAGFRAAVTTQPGALSRELASRPTAMPRVSLNGYFQKPRYVRALISGLLFPR